MQNIHVLHNITYNVMFNYLRSQCLRLPDLYFLFDVYQINLYPALVHKRAFRKYKYFNYLQNKISHLNYK